MAHSKLDADQTARFLKAVEELSALTDEQRAKLASALEELAYEDGECLWEVGDRADWLCLIREGTVTSTSSYREPLTFKVGSFFGTQVTPALSVACQSLHRRMPPRSRMTESRACARNAGAQGRPEHEAIGQGGRAGAREGL